MSTRNWRAKSKRANPLPFSLKKNTVFVPERVKYEVFSNVGTHFWHVPLGVSNVDYLVVGGGGGGGGAYDNAGAGGGAAGAVVTGSFSVFFDQSFTLIVGAGGLGGSGTGTVFSGPAGSDTPGLPGQTSSIGASIFAEGGEGGFNTRSYPDGKDYSKGGNQVGFPPTAGSGGFGGFNGGGGGGNGGPGVDGDELVTGTGGPGIENTLYDVLAGIYGVGGDAGSAGISAAGMHGEVNSGNGGGGASAAPYDGNAGGNGGSGIIVFKYTQCCG